MNKNMLLRCPYCNNTEVKFINILFNNDISKRCTYLCLNCKEYFFATYDLTKTNK